MFVVSHKPYNIPQETVYKGIGVGKGGSTIPGFVFSDSTGINISEKNDSYCELTALYWIWKNTNYDAYGLVHYRRYFQGRVKNSIANKKELCNWLIDSDMVVAKPRNYVIETVYTHYSRAHYRKDILLAKQVVTELYPSYKYSFDAVMNQSSLSLYNMFVMKKAVMEKYCEWLFSILAECENRIDVTGYDRHQQRVIGFLGERLFNVWLFENRKDYRIGHQKIVHLEGEQYFRKALSLIKRKFLGPIWLGNSKY